MLPTAPTPALLIQMSILPLPNAAAGGEQLRAKVILAIQKKPGN